MLITNVLDFPNLEAASILGLDCETFDPDLLDSGPGWARHFGNLVGVSLATLDNQAWYFPIGHILGDNLPVEPTIAYLSHTLSIPRPKIGANLMFDIGWLRETGIKTQGPFYDVQFAEALLDGNAISYSLETIAHKYLKKGKLGEDLYQWAAEKYRGQPTAKDQASNIYRSPAELVAPYACEDARLPIAILQRQQVLLEKAGLEDLFVLECELIPLLVEMRLRGMPIDEEKAYQLRDDLIDSERIQHDMLYELAGFHVNVNSSRDIARLFDKFNLTYGHTDKGNPSFTATWLNQQTTPLAKKINNLRKTIKARTTFIESAILNKEFDGKIYPTLHPLRDGSKGTITGRFSSSKPNSQNFSARDEILAPLIRSIFIPEKGFTHWLKIDFSQIEFRMFAHFSQDQALLDAYKDPKTDFHEAVSQLLGGAIPRKYVKNYNFATLYGAGVSKIASLLSTMMTATEATTLLRGLGGTSTSEIFLALAKKLASIYEKKFPAAKALTASVSRQVQDNQEIRTLLNRRIIFDKYLPKMNSKNLKALPYQAAINVYGYDLQLANTHKAVNYLLQGSAADFIKQGMVNAYKVGIFEKIGYPHCVVHDELDFSFNKDMRNDFREFKEILETAIPLRVPVIANCSIGLNWGTQYDYE